MHVFTWSQAHAASVPSQWLYALDESVITADTVNTKSGTQPFLKGNV